MTILDSLSVDPLIPPLQDNAYLIPLIADVTGTDVVSVRERLRREHLYHPHNVPEAFGSKGIEPYTWSQGLLDFYEETDSFIYELVVWNRSQLKCAMRNWMLCALRRYQMPKGRVLFCGDGIGIDSFFFAQAGYDVVFYEVSQYGQQMAQRLFNDYNVKVQIADTLETCEAESFDVIFSLDVLEHIPTPPTAVQELSKLLRPGGFLVLSAPFFAIHPQWPTHLKSNRKYSGRTAWLEKAGQMKLIDGCTFGNPFVFQKCGGDGQRMISMPWNKSISLLGSKLLLRFFVMFPSLVIRSTLFLHRRDPHLKRLLPEDL